MATQTDKIDMYAFCDIVAERAEEARQKYGCTDAKIYTDYHELLEDPEICAVHVLTPNVKHCEISCAAMEAGKHVICEKPMAATAADAKKMLDTSKRTGKLLTIGYQYRHFDANRAMKDYVSTGALGDIYYAETTAIRRRGIPTPFGTSFITDGTAGIGAVGDIGCYSLDMVLNAIGYPKPLTVSGYKSAFFGTDPNYCNYVKTGHPEYAKAFAVDDFAAAFIRLEGGIVLDFRIAWAMNMDTPGDTIILGDKGGLRIPSTECWNGTVGGPMRLYHEVCGEQTETVIPVIVSEDEKKGISLFDKKIRSFLDAIKEGGSAPVPSSQILYNQAIIDGIVRSAEAGHEVEITIPEI